MISTIFNLSKIKRILENIFYPKKTKDLPGPELFSIAVKSEFQGRQIGKELLKRFVSEMKIRKVNVFKVLVGSKSDAVKFYQNTGFELKDKIVLHGKEESLIFTYKINK